LRDPRTTSSYLLETASGYVFRYCIPKNLKLVVGKSELRYSLKTGQLGLAKRRARHMASYVQMMIANIQNGGTVSRLSEEMINGLINKYIRDLLEADEKDRIMQHGPLGDDLYSEQLMAYDYVQDTFRHELAHCDISNTSKHVDKFVLQANEIEADKGSMEYKKLCREILKVQIHLTEIFKERELGNYSSEIKYQPEPKSNLTQPQAEPETQQEERLSEIIDMYVAESEKAGTWTEKTKSEIKSILDLFQKIVGDIPVDVIDKGGMRKSGAPGDHGLNTIEMCERDVPIEEIVKLSISHLRLPDIPERTHLSCRHKRWGNSFMLLFEIATFLGLEYDHETINIWNHPYHTQNYIGKLDPKADTLEHLGAFIFQHNEHQIIFASDGRELSGKQRDNYWKRYMEGESTFSLYEDLATKLKLK